MENILGKIVLRFLGLQKLIDLKKDKTLQEVYKITKGIKKYSKPMYDDLIDSFVNMATGGEGGPYMMGYTWTTVRRYHYDKWTDEMFEKLLELLGESEKFEGKRDRDRLKINTTRSR